MQFELLRRYRQDLHGMPELGMREHLTAAYVAEVLEGVGAEVTRGVGGTGVVGVLRRGGGPGIGLRADMDGLPLAERGGKAYASRHDGVMHACGHDGHMAMVLGAMAVLAEEGGFSGTVTAVFQPAEEHGLGARAMMADGLFERFPMRAMFGIHNMPGHPAGRLATRVGGLMAGEDNFEIRVVGRGGHAARPQMVVDPIVIAAEIVLALQTVVSRSVDPAEPAVVSCTEITTDGARNAIPGEVVIRGDTRSFSGAVRAVLERRIRELCDGIAAAHGGRCVVRYTHEFEPTVNHPDAVATALVAARMTVAAGEVDADTPPWTASEDFGAFLGVVPGCFMLLGNGSDSVPLHSPDYDFNDDALEVGVRYYVNLVRTALPHDLAQ